MFKFIKKHRVISCLLTYMLVWFVFGIVYYVLANISEGDMFHFQNDILLKSKVVAFQKELGMDTDYETTKALFTEESDISRMKMTTGEYPLLTYNLTSYGLKTIGTNWAKFYYSNWINQGYNYYKLEIVEEDQQLIGPREYLFMKLTVCSIPEEANNSETLNQYNIYTAEINDKITKKQDYFITIDEKVLENFDFNHYYPLYHDIFLISQSVNYLDESINIFYDYKMNESFRYPLIDFLYFSAVTISTLGYGDILPNATCIRLLVMMETLLGSIILAVFISLFYDYIKNSKFRLRSE